MSHSKNIQTERSYGNASIIKKSAEETHIRKSHRNSLLAKAKTLETLTEMKLSVKLQG